MGSNILYLDTKLMCHEAKDAEDDKSSKHTGEAVANSHHDTVPEDIVAEVVVAGQSDHSSPSDTQREEYLDASICPNTDAGQFVPLWGQIEHDAIHISWQGCCPHKKDYQDQVRKKWCEVDKLNISKHW